MSTISACYSLVRSQKHKKVGERSENEGDIAETNISDEPNSSSPSLLLLRRILPLYESSVTEQDSSITKCTTDGYRAGRISTKSYTSTSPSFPLVSNDCVFMILRLISWLFHSYNVASQLSAFVLHIKSTRTTFL